MSTTPVQTLKLKTASLSRRPSASPIVLVASLMVSLVVPSSPEDHWMWIRIANRVLAAMCMCSMAHALEDAWHLQFARRSLPQRILAHLSLMMGTTVFCIVIAYVVGVPLKSIGDGGTGLVVIMSGMLWLNLAAAGSLLVMLLDRIIRPFTHEFHNRMNTAVLTLVGLMAFAAYWTATAGYDALHLSGEAMPTVFKLDLGFGAVWNMDPVYVKTWTSSTEFMAQTYFAFMVAMATPAMMSASAKLAQTLMADLDPIRSGFAAVARGELDFRIPEEGTTDFAALNATFNTMVQSLGMAKRMEHAFGAYVSGEILDQIKNQHGEANLEPTLRMATVFFADIRGFTTLSERINPKQLLAILNRFYEEVATVVQAHRGFLVQYIGDAVVVVFNGPLEQPNHAEMAAACAIDVQRSVDRLNALELFPEAGDLQIGIGIATGPLVAGNLGDSGHLLQYTVLGDTVNQAARLTGLTPPGAVYVNLRNAEMIDPSYDPLPLDAVKVKGRARKLQPHQIWPCVDHTDVTEIRARPLPGWPIGEA